MKSRSMWLLLSCTPLFVLLAHYTAVLPHEFMHSFAAWATGIKSDPWDIHWGGGSIGNALLLYDIDEKIDYKTAYAGGHAAAVAFAVIAGPGTNGLLYLFARFVLPWWRTSSRPWVAYLGLWVLLMQLANLYDYVPIRVAASDGDVHQWIRATGTSPYAVYIVIGYLVLWAAIDLYRRVLPDALAASRIDAAVGKAIVLILVTAIFFGYFAIPGLLEDESAVTTLFIARTSLLLIPVVILVNWRRIVLPLTLNRRPDDELADLDVVGLLDREGDGSGDGLRR